MSNRKRINSAQVLATKRSAVSLLEGGLLGVTPEGVVGWAINASEPERPVRVFLLANDTVVATTEANRFDIALVRARIGAGVPGFLLVLNALPEGSFPLTLTIREAGGKPIGAPLLVRHPEDLGPLPQSPLSNTYKFEGMVEGLQAGRLIGWVWNKVNPAQAVVVELFDGMDPMDRRFADEFRGDLADAGKRGGHCGFSFELPASLLDGRAHSLRVCVFGAQFELANTPIVFGPLALSNLIQEISSLRAEVLRLSRSVDFAVAPNGAFQSGLLRELNERVGAYAEIQREMIESELDALRAIASWQEPIAQKAPRRTRRRRGLCSSRGRAE